MVEKETSALPPGSAPEHGTKQSRTRVLKLFGQRGGRQERLWRT